jgi:hypothetical protein
MSAQVSLIKLTDAASTVLLPVGAPWRYDITSNQDDMANREWMSPSFADAAWASGASPLGFGFAGLSTVLSNDWRMNSYFRKTVTVSNPSSVTAYALLIAANDGFVV